MPAYVYEHISHQQGEVRQVSINRLKTKLQIVHSAGWNSPKTILEHVHSHSAAGGVNGSFWNPDFSPCAILKANGVLLSYSKSFWGAIGWSEKNPSLFRSEYLSIERKDAKSDIYIEPKYGNHGIKDPSNSAKWEKLDYIISGKFLIHKGIPEPLHPNDHALSGPRPKTIICILSADNWRLLVTNGLDTALLTQLLLQDGCKEALMLDGGGSSSLVTENIVWPTENLRKIPDAIVFKDFSH